MKRNKKQIIAMTVTLLLCTFFVLPSVAVNANASERKLIPLGRTTGIKIFSGGAMVVGFATLDGSDGLSPAQVSGLNIGDVIMAVNGKEVQSNEELSAALASLEKPEATLTIKRDGKEMNIEMTSLSPQASGAGYMLGAWVRDSMAGIGTITFVDPETGEFGALGHGICDVDTGALMPFDNGSVMESTVTGVIKGTAGAPGQLTGSFNLKADSGILFKNSYSGIFGKLYNDALYYGLKAYEVADYDEIEVGKVEIVSNIDGVETETYSARITKILNDEKGSSRDFMIEITDKSLIEATGGIVQGMSGSPIIQNGKLIGAVTHVLVNDPKRGYGISIENMTDTAAQAAMVA